ncbi:MAG: CBS domain-containing protein [Desulfotomaculales bacterium]
MDIITTHTNTDLDALAAMVAAQKLYPEAVLVFPGKLLPNVEEFVSLHKDTLPVRAVKEIEPSRVKRVVLVDTKNPRRLGKLGEILKQGGCELHIYDHHPWAEGDLRGSLEVVEMVGATATLLVEKIRELKIPLTPLEATILALGIYGDTGSLVFTSTTPRDVAAVAFLLEKGANLGVVADFLGRPLSEEQKALLKTLLISARRHQVNGVKILLSAAAVPEFVVGLATLTHTISEIERLDAVFTVVEMEDRVYIVGRSNVPQVNVAEILELFGGSGHAAAASATVKGGKAGEAADRLLAAVKEKVRPPLTCAGIMSSPVKTVSPGTTIGEAGRIMLRYGHTGLPVVKGEKLVGVISRRDVEKAIHHGLGHAPVKGFMTTSVVWAPPELPVNEVQRMMIEHDIGRVPIVKEGRLVGIVSRTDVLRTLHGNLPPRHRVIYNSTFQALATNVGELLKKNVSPFLFEIMVEAGETGEKMGYGVYAAGGFVRDVFLGAENLDLDLVVEGDGIALARALGGRHGVKVRVHEQFGTAEIDFPGLKVDVATARVEFYEYPAALPQVESSTLHQDLYRRDFTINAMAIALNKERFGELIDFFGGRQDLAEGLVRVLYNLSFIEDPTRILRAVRFAARCGFRLEEQTEKFLWEAVRQRVLARVSCERVGEEIKKILKEEKAPAALFRLHELELFADLFPGVDYTGVEPVLQALPFSLADLLRWGFFRPEERWFSYFLALLHRTPPAAARALCEKYHLSKKETEKVEKVLALWPETAGRLGREPLPELARLLLDFPREAYPLLLAAARERGGEDRFREALFLLRESRPQVGGDFIKSLGLRPGPVYRKVLDAVWQARLEGRIKTEEEEMDFVREYLQKKDAGRPEAGGTGDR